MAFQIVIGVAFVIGGVVLIARREALGSAARSGGLKVGSVAVGVLGVVWLVLGAMSVGFALL